MVRDDKNCDTLTGTTFFPINDEPFKSIFKKSEHDEIMDELAEIKRKLDNLQPSPWIPYPYPYPYVPYEPYPCIPYDPYPKPYCYCNELLWTTVDVSCT